MAPIKDFVSSSIRVQHVYADGTSGSDSNSGKSGSPVKTLGRAFGLLPDVITKNTCVHLTGEFNINNETVDSFSQFWTKFDSRSADVLVVIDGGSDTTVVKDDTGLPYQADIYSTTALGKTGAGWTADAYVGYWVEITGSSPAAGQTRSIHKNTTDTITPQWPWSVDPGLNAEFKIVRPATRIYASTSDVRMRWNAINHFITIQRVFFDGANLDNLFTCNADSPSGSTGWQLFGVILNNTRAGGMFGSSNWLSDRIYTSSWYYNPDTFAQVTGSTNPQISLSSVAGKLLFGGCTANLYSLHATSPVIVHKGAIDVMRYFRCTAGLIIENVQTSADFNETAQISGSATSPSAITNGSGIGLHLINSKVSFGSDIDISDCSSHGIEADGSKISFFAIVSGTGNGGVGLYAHQGSQVTIKDGSPPTLTGTVGDVAVTDPESEDTTWADVDAGNPLQIAAESTAIREVA